jgi:hypothetical protein
MEAKPAHRQGAATRAQMPALLKGLIYGPNGRSMSPSHRRVRIYRYYVTREAIANRYDSCAVTRVPAVDVDSAVLDRIQKLLAAPELVARTWPSAKRQGEDEITGREVTVLLTDFAAMWTELFPAEQARIVQLLGAGGGAGGRPQGADQGRGPREPRRRAAPGRRDEGGTTRGVETRLDGSTLVVRIPTRFQRRGGRKRIVAPTMKPQPDGTLVISDCAGVAVAAAARQWRI